MRLRDLLTQPLMIDPRAMPSFLMQVSEDHDHEIKDGPARGTESYLIDCSDSEMRRNEIGGGKPDHEAEDGSLLAVVPLTGVVSRHGIDSWYGYYPGTADIGRSLKALDQNKAIGAIVLYIDSPGGQVSGTPELAEIVYDIRKAGNTKIVAAVDTLMASAATYIGTACEKVYAMSTAMCGSIGVISSYTEYSKYLENMGISTEVFREPALKARFSGVEPMDDDMRDTMNERNQVIYDRFVDDVAKYRGVNATTVKKKFGGGEVMFAEDALEAGLIDGVATPDDVINMVFDDLSASQQEIASKRKEKQRATLLAHRESATAQLAELEADITSEDGS